MREQPPNAVTPFHIGLARVKQWAKPLWERTHGPRIIRALRASLSLRTALGITAVGVVIFAVFSLVVSVQLTDAAFDARRTAILDDAALRFSTVRSSFDQSAASTPDQVQEIARQMVENIQTSAAGAGAVSAMLLRAPDASSTFRINEIVNIHTQGVLDEELRSAVNDGGAHWQSILIPADGNVPASPGIIVGHRVQLPRAGAQELYIVYSLASDQAMVNLVMKVLALASLPIVIIVPLGVFWAIYHLLRPVRRTAEAATGIAGGDLSARVPVTGIDEMAQLGTAFNDMASSLQRQISEYDELSQLQQRFVSDVSHELRTPLTTIRMAEEMIWEERHQLTGAGRRSAELLHGQVERFESMLADLLEISRYDAHSADLESEMTDVRLIVGKVVEANSELARRLGVTVQVNHPKDRCAAEMDFRRIERVIRNLLVNALEHAEGRPVTIDIACSETDVAVRVRDRGVGMSPETVSRVFDRFFRADPARARTTGGTGLGLAMAMEDIRLHNGTLEATGELGQGSSFLMTLPKYSSETVMSHPLELWEDE